MGTPKPTALQGVAQLGERLVWDQEVAGSTPVTLTICFVVFVFKSKTSYQELRELV